MKIFNIRLKRKKKSKKKEKAYCSKCRYSRSGFDGTHSCSYFKEYQDTYWDRIVSYPISCHVMNQNNDCPYFKPSWF